MNTSQKEKSENVPPDMAYVPPPAPPSRGPGGQKPAILVVLALVLICAGGVIFLALGAFRYIQTNNPMEQIAQVISGTYTPVPTITPTPTPVPTPTPLPNPQLSPGRVVYSYPFDKAQGWPIMMISDEYATIKRSVADGKYRWTVSATKGFFNHTMQAAHLPGNESVYQISVDVRVTEGPSTACFGLIFGNVDDTTFWLWDVSDDGIGMLVEMVDNEWQEPAATNLDMPVRKGETNTLTVKFSGTTIYYYVNGWLAGEYTRPAENKHSFISDKVGLSIELSNPGDQATYEFDNYIVSVPEKFEK